MLQDKHGPRGRRTELLQTLCDSAPGRQSFSSRYNTQKPLLQRVSEWLIIAAVTQETKRTWWASVSLGVILGLLKSIKPFQLSDSKSSLCLRSTLIGRRSNYIFIRNTAWILGVNRTESDPQLAQFYFSELLFGFPRSIFIWQICCFFLFFLLAFHSLINKVENIVHTATKERFGNIWSEKYLTTPEP